MRGAFGAGVLTGLAEGGLAAGSFDALFGVSAGLLNLAYWVSGRPREATQVYADDILNANDPPFFLYQSRSDLLSRLARGQPVVDMRAVQRAMSERRPIDLAAVRSHAAPIWFPVTRARELTTEFVDARGVPSDQLVSTLTAAASVPALAEPIELDRIPFIDGACGSPLPLTDVVLQGFSDVVIILNLPRGIEPAWYEPHALRILASRRGLSRRIGHVVQRARETRRHAIQLLERGVPGVRFTIFAPSTLPGRTLERQSHVVRGAIDAGIEVGRVAVHRAGAGLRGAFGSLAIQPNEA